MFNRQLVKELHDEKVFAYNLSKFIARVPNLCCCIFMLWKNFKLFLILYFIGERQSCHKFAEHIFHWKSKLPKFCPFKVLGLSTLGMYNNAMADATPAWTFCDRFYNSFFVPEIPLHCGHIVHCHLHSPRPTCLTHTRCQRRLGGRLKVANPASIHGSGTDPRTDVFHTLNIQFNSLFHFTQSNTTCTVFQIIYVINKLYIESGCFQLFIHDIGFGLVDMHVLWK